MSSEVKIGCATASSHLFALYTAVRPSPQLSRTIRAMAAASMRPEPPRYWLTCWLPRRLLLLDYMFFEGDGDLRIDLMNGSCHYKCCDLYCLGCVCPCYC